MVFSLRKGSFKIELEQFTISTVTFLGWAVVSDSVPMWWSLVVYGMVQGRHCWSVKAGFRIVTKDRNYCLVIACKWRSLYPWAILFVCLSQSTLAICPQVTISTIMGQAATPVAKVGKSLILKRYPLFFIIIQSDHPSATQG